MKNKIKGLAFALLFFLIGGSFFLIKSRLNFIRNRFEILCVVHPTNWTQQTPKTGENLLLEKSDSKSQATDNFLQTDYAEIFFFVLDKEKIKDFIPQKSELGHYNDFESDELLSVNSSSIKFHKKVVPLTKWTTGTSNGIAVYFPIQSNHFLLIKMLYGGKEKDSFERVFFQITRSIIE